uniref:C-type lectin domain-containing protein n=1 Tax=Periophthalmus magnuspinnatus TaxID=409849 RepID=A0A3B4AE41_9GOBI
KYTITPGDFTVLNNCIKGSQSFCMFLCFAHTERQFVFVDTPMDWTSAQTYCRQKYTDLVTVYDDQENQELTELAPNTNMNIWIGLRHKVNKWRWSMGDPPLSDNKYETIWAPTQPDNKFGDQHCAEVFAGTFTGVFDRECWLISRNPTNGLRKLD